LAINLVIPETVLRKLNDLPKEVRLKFWEQLERLTDNPAHPGLRKGKLKGTGHWAFSITMNYRATYIRGKATIIITAVGTHEEVLGK
jgi:mRNA-degrading endonuclease RelE of RelBE toxin-antitoxin system